MRQVTRFFVVLGIVSLLLGSAGCEFRQTRYTLSVSVNGSGSVSPTGGTYREDTTVTLTAVADSGFEFVGWSGDVSGTSATIQVMMDSDKIVTANFSPSTQQRYTLTTYTNGSGSVTPVDGEYFQGTTVALTATPSSGWAFESWSGDVSGANPRIQVVMNANKTVIANFYASSSEPEEFEPVPNAEASGSYQDSSHFRVYNAGNSTSLMLAHLESAYKCFVTDWGFRSSGLSVFDNENDGPYYKMNVISGSISAGGYMGYDSRRGLAYLLINSRYTSQPHIFVHEYGHALTLHEINWMDQTRTGAWWETVANWVADTYLNSSYYEDVQQQYGLGEGGTIIELDVLISNSYMTIVCDQNYYQAWPFLTYLTNNPDNYPGLGRMAVPDLFRNHTRNNETPLHVLEQISSSVSVQTILGRYWARMAYLDIGHERAQQSFFAQRGRLNFANLDSYGNQVYRVKSNRRPMYGGANIIPLSMTGSGSVSIDITNLGNGLSESDFTATLAIRSDSGSVRYVDLPGGYGSATVGYNEEASLVVVNTPDTLYQYDAFETTSRSPEAVGLNYQVEITGAVPAH